VLSLDLQGLKKDYPWFLSYKEIGLTELEVIIKNLDGVDPLLYAAKRAIGPRQPTEEETKNTARRAFQNNPGLTSSEIGYSPKNFI
jgi:hypothetical protein